MNRTSVSIISLIAVASVACSTDEGTSTGQVGLTMRAAAASHPDVVSVDTDTLVMFDAADTPYRISAAQLHLRDIELDLPDGMRCADLESQPVGASCEDGEDKIRIDGPIIVDLVSGATTPSLADVKIPAGIYDRIDFRVEDGDPEDGVVTPGSALDDRSFVVTAAFELDGAPKTLELSLHFNEDIRIERPSGVEVAPGEDLVATWLTNDWLAGVDVASCLDQGDVVADGDSVVIDDDTNAGSCSDIENTIKSNMKNSGQLGGA